MKLLNLNSSSTVTDGVYQLQPFGESLTKIDCATWKSLKFRLALSKCVQKCMFVTYFDYKLHADGYLTSKEKIQTLAYFFWSLSGFWSWIVHKFTEIGLCGDRKSPLSIPLFFAPEKFIFRDDPVYFVRSEHLPTCAMLGNRQTVVRKKLTTN